MKKLLRIGLGALLLLVGATAGYASSHSDWADKYLDRICVGPRVRGVNAVLCSFRDRLSSLETAVANIDTPSSHKILDYGQVRGANWETDASANNIETPDHVTVDCPVACALWVNFDVDTRNTQSSGTPTGYNHLYSIYVDGVDQAVFNQASFPVPDTAIPLAVNGVFPVSADSHIVTIYARATGGHLQQFESHLQVLAIEQ